MGANKHVWVRRKVGLEYSLVQCTPCLSVLEYQLTGPVKVIELCIGLHPLSCQVELACQNAAASGTHRCTYSRDS